MIQSLASLPSRPAAIQGRAGHADFSTTRRYITSREKTRTLILFVPGRGWFPTGRPAEAHACEVGLLGAQAAETIVGESTYRIRGSRR